MLQRASACVRNRGLCFQRAAFASQVSSGSSVPSPASSSADAWRGDKDKYKDLHRLPGGRQPPRDFGMGPYAHTMHKDPETGKVYPVARFFASPREDPVTFVVNCLIVLTTVWTISQLSWGESFFEKRKRVIRERIRQEYGLPKGWEHDIEDDGDLQLSEEQPSGSAAAGTAGVAR
eukprot:TRINITY_DN33973_c0_g1_i1.p1 TRINITY_DN33973_c0_g1~~TRINITY_DN33973_c0_g1_i1.p1  ORF type:complete len:176 (-),score=26.35 TRINITY_DN33973_c0_g1_i1:73-600(-)